MNPKQDPELVYAFDRNKDQQIQVRLRDFKGNQFIDYRLWYTKKDATGWFPTTKGITVSVYHLPELKKSLLAITDALKQRNEEVAREESLV